MTQAIGYRGERPPARLNLARYCLAELARTRPPTHPALVVIADAAAAPEKALVWSYAGLEDAVLRAGAALIDRGLRPGDRLLIRLEHSASYAILFFAATAVGLVPIPASPALTAAEIAFLIDDSAPGAIVAAPVLPLPDILGSAQVIEAAEVARFVTYARRASYADTTADDPAYLVYTSGTTSHPKGVLHAHRVVWGRRPMRQGWHGLDVSDRLLHTGALNWTYALGTGLMDPLATGATALVYTGEREPMVWPRLIRDHRASMLAAVPALYRQMLKYAGAEIESLDGLRHVLSAGETLGEPVRQAWLARSGVPIFEAFGMSELSTYISSGPETPPRAGFLGRPQPGRSIAILSPDGAPGPLAPGEVGLLAAHRSDPGLMLGYWRRPDEEREVLRGDWFAGGDLAAMDVDGYVAFHGRANDLMNAFGYRVSPAEVEAVLEHVPGVAEVAVAELVVGEGKTVIAAFVVTLDGAGLTAGALIGHAQSRLAAYKCPREVVFVGALPRNRAGKIDRKRLVSIARH